MRDIGFLLLAAWLIVRPRSRLALDNVLVRPAVDSVDEADEQSEADDLMEEQTGGRS